MNHVEPSERPIDQTYRLSAAQATELLAQKKVAFDAANRPGFGMQNPETPVQALNRLDQLSADPAWRDRVLSNDVDARAEFNRLTDIAAKGGPVEYAMKGIVPDGYINTEGGADIRAMADGAAAFRAQGSSEQAIHDILSDKKPTREQHELAKRELPFRAAELVERIKLGDSAAKVEFRDLCWAYGCFEEG